MLTQEQIEDLDNQALSEDNVGHGAAIIDDKLHAMMILDRKLNELTKMCKEINVRCDDIQQRCVELDRMVTQVYDDGPIQACKLRC